MDKLDKFLADISMSKEDWIDSKDDDLSIKDVMAAKVLGIEKPYGVSISYWKYAGSDIERPVVTRVIHLRALGKTERAISEEVGMTLNGVQKILAKPGVRIKVQHKQEMMFENDAKHYMKSLMSKAYTVVEEILDNEEERGSVRLEASKFVIDHVVGRASQTVEHKGSLLVELISRLDSTTRETANIIEAQYDKDVAVNDEDLAAAKKLVEPMKDALDSIVDNILGEEMMVVGKRTD